MKVAFLMDDIGLIKPLKDTSFRLALEAQERGWEIHYIESNSLFFNQQVCAPTQRLTVVDSAENYHTLSAPDIALLCDFDAIFLRSDPPFDDNYLYRTQLLDLVKDEVLVVNDPTSVRSFNEKIFALKFPQYTASTIITREISALKSFLKTHQKIVVKPLDSMGGNGIFVVNSDDPNVSVIFETQTNAQQNLLMAQKYLPEISMGDKRILLINGEPVSHVLARIPADGESRGNLNAGASGKVQPISDNERLIAQEIGAYCVQEGLLLVGLDMIGDKITEINVTSPTCMREIENFTGLNLAAKTLDVLEIAFERHH